jgi:hypothetical protein
MSKTVLKRQLTRRPLSGISVQCTAGCKSAGEAALALGCREAMGAGACAASVRGECGTTHCEKYSHSVEKMHLAQLCKLGCEQVAASACARSTGLLARKLKQEFDEL